MGVTKTKGFNEQINDMAEVLKALGHPARLAIIKCLAERPSCICNDLVDKIPLAQPTVSRHLSELKKVGLIRGIIEGKRLCYCIDEKRWMAVKKMVDKMASSLKSVDKCC